MITSHLNEWGDGFIGQQMEPSAHMSNAPFLSWIERHNQLNEQIETAAADQFYNSPLVQPKPAWFRYSNGVIRLDQVAHVANMPTDPAHFFPEPYSFCELIGHVGNKEFILLTPEEGRELEKLLLGER